MKAKFEQIDLTQISEKGKKVLLAIKKQTKNFTEVTEGQRNVFNKLYDKIKQTKPEAIKPRKSKAKKSTKRKVTGKQGVFMKLAKSIRDKNPNLTWKQAQAKASAELKESREKETKKLNSEIEKFVKNNKEYQKAFGSGTSNLQKDAKQPAKKIGKRVSKNGKTYYEYRRNRTDVSPQGFPMLEKGGLTKDEKLQAKISADDFMGQFRKKKNIVRQNFGENTFKEFDKIVRNKIGSGKNYAKGGEIEVDNSHKLTHKGKKYLIEWDRERNGSPIKYRTFITEDKVGGKLVSRNKDKKLFDEIYDKLLSKYAKGGKVKAKKEIVEGLEKLEVGLAGASKKHKQQSKLAKQIKDGFESSFEKGGFISYEGNLFNPTNTKKHKTEKEAEARIKKLKGDKNGEKGIISVEQFEMLNKYQKGGKTQGYNDKLDESLGMRKRKKVIKKQSYKDRRDESKGMEKSMGRRAYQSVGTMDKMAKGGKVSATDITKVIEKKKLKGMDLPLFKVIGGKVNHYPMGSKIEPIKKAEYIRAKSPQEASEKYTQIHNNMVMSSELDDDRWVTIHFAKGGRTSQDYSKWQTAMDKYIKAKEKGDEAEMSKQSKIINSITKNYAKGGAIKGRNNKTGESFGVVIGSMKYTDEDKDRVQVDVRSSYSSRISERQLVFNTKGNLIETTNYGYTLDGTLPKRGSGQGKSINASNKKETIDALVDLGYNKGFANKLIDAVKDEEFAKGGKVKKDYTEFYEKGGSVKEIEVGNTFSLYNHLDNEMVDVKVKEKYKSILGTNTIKFDDVDGEELVLSEHIFRETLRDNGYKEYAKGGKISMPKEIKEKFFEEDGTPKSDEKTYRELFQYTQKLPDTKSKHYNTKTGKYSKSRQKLHKEIINEFKDDAVCIERDEPIAILMGGSPASGKSTFLRSYAPFLLKDEILRIDADEVRSMLPEYEGWNADVTHRETKDIVETLLSDKTIGIPCTTDIIYDGTMNNVKRYTPLVKFLKKQGYKVYVVYIDNVPKKDIEERIRGRYKRSGRYVPIEVVDDFFQKGKTALNKIKKEADGYMIVDGGSKNYKVIEKGGFKIPTDRKYSKLGTPLKKRINRN